MNTFLYEVIMGLIEGFIFLYLFLFISNKRELLTNKKTINILFLITYTIFSSWATLSFPSGYHTIIILLFISISISFITDTKYYLALTTVIFIGIIVITLELLLLLLFSYVTKTTTETLQTNHQIKLYFTVLVRLIQIISLIIFSKKKSPIIKSFSKEFRYPIVNYWFFGIFLMIILIISIRFVMYQPEKILLYEILMTLTFVLYTLLGYLDYKEKIRLINIQKKYEVQDEHIKNLESLMNIIRREKHDFSNHINTIYAMCTLNKENTVNRIKNYLSKISENLKDSYHIFNSGNDYIDGLLAVKSNFAYENEIILDVNFEVMLDLFNINDTDLISIISNILDNSFEAILTSKNLAEKPIVSLWTYLEDNKCIISISNNGPKISEENLIRIFENGYSTKNKNKDDHGLGLYIVKNIIEKNNGEIKVNSNDMETEFQIVFNNTGVTNEFDRKSITISN